MSLDRSAEIDPEMLASIGADWSVAAYDRHQAHLERHDDTLQALLDDQTGDSSLHVSAIHGFAVHVEFVTPILPDGPCEIDTTTDVYYLDYLTAGMIEGVRSASTSPAGMDSLLRITDRPDIHHYAVRFAEIRHSLSGQQEVRTPICSPLKRALSLVLMNLDDDNLYNIYLRSSFIFVVTGVDEGELTERFEEHMRS